MPHFLFGVRTLTRALRIVARPGYDLDRVLMVDDESHKLEKNHGSLIPIAPFTGDSDDTELPLLLR